MQWWERAKQENHHLKQAVGEDGATHRTPDAYLEAPMKERIASIAALFRGNAAQIFRFTIERKDKSATLSKKAITENEKYRLHFIARHYLGIEDVTEINKVDDDVLYALFEDVNNNKVEVAHQLPVLKALLIFPLQKQLACIRWGAIEFLYEVLIEAFEMSKAPEFRRFLGISVDKGPIASSAFGVGIYHAVNKLADVMPTWSAILLTSGFSTLATIISYSYQYFRINGCSHTSRQGDYTLLEEGGDDFLTSRTRPLTHVEKEALAKRLGWKITMLFTIYLASIKIAIQNYTLDTVEAFFNKYTGGVLPPGSLDYIILMLTHAMTKAALHHLNISHDK